MIRTVNSIFFVVGLRKCKLMGFEVLDSYSILQTTTSTHSESRPRLPRAASASNATVTGMNYKNPPTPGPGSCLPTGRGRGNALSSCTSPLATPLVHSTVLYTCFPPGYAPGTLYSTEHPNPCTSPPPTSLLSFSTGGNPL